MSTNGRPRKEIKESQLRGLLRMKPTLADTAAFFECDESTIVNYIKREFGVTFSEFRQQNLVHSKFGLIRKAMQKADKGDNTMLVFCLKNLADWKEKTESENTTTNIQINIDADDEKA